MLISLTSFPARLPYIATSLSSLVLQKASEDRVVLWLGREQFPHGVDDIPEPIRSFSTDKGGAVEFRFTEDIRSFTKLIPALEEFPEETIITVDDDVAYDPQTIKILREAHKKNPKAIFAHSVSDLYKCDGKWHRTTGTFGFHTSPQPLRMMLGIGAVLYPPHSIDALACKRELFQKLCPTNDDIWFWYCAAKRGTPIRRVHHAINRPRMIAATSIGALSATNEVNGDKVNREYIRRICDHDPDFAKLLDTVYSRHFHQIACARLSRLLFHYPRQALFCLTHGGFNFLKAELRRLRGNA